MTRLRCAITDDYLNLSTRVADWSPLKDRADITVFNEPFSSTDEAAAALKDFEIICAMRERTPFPRALFAALPKLKLLITSGMRNAAIDMEAAKDHDVVLCGTQWGRDPTAPLTMGLILELTRHIGFENNKLKSGTPWQTTLGPDVEGMNLGIIGLGKLGTRVGEIGKAFRMKVSAWSQNITQERADKAGFGYAASKEDLLKQSDIVSIHIPLTPKSRGLLGATELSLLTESGAPIA